jgi:hypothetical protein
MQRTQCSVMQNRKDAWTLATQSWWTLSTHAVAFSASETLTPTWTSILTKGLRRNQDATHPITPVGVFVLTYTFPCTGPKNGAEGERRIVNNTHWLGQLVGGILPRIPVLDPRALHCRSLSNVALAWGFYFRELHSFADLIVSPIFHTHISFIHIARINAPLTCPASFSAVLDTFPYSSLASHSVT